MDAFDSATQKDLESIAQGQSVGQQAGAPLPCFIHITRLRRIKSSIQQSVYRVDKSSILPQQIIDRFLAELSAWKDQIPEEPPVRENEAYVYDGYIYYMVYYYKALRLLLYPHLNIPGRPAPGRREMRRSVRRHLSYVQTPAPQDHSGVLAHGAVFRVSVRLDAPVLHMALPERSI